MLSNNINEPLINLDKCSLHELIYILQSFSNDPSFNVHQNGFGSNIANHVIKEKIQRYNNEAMLPPKLGDVWIRSSVNILSKDLCDLLFFSCKTSYITHTQGLQNLS
jgi:hypothetical protein